MKWCFGTTWIIQPDCHTHRMRTGCHWLHYWPRLARLFLGPLPGFAARVGFLAVAAALPPLTAALAWSLSARRDLAITSGLLSVFPAFYVPFLPVTDTFGPYMLLGGLFFLLLSNSLTHATARSWLITAFLLGIISGLMHLSRTDGLIWFLLALTAVLFFRKSGQSPISILYSLGCVSFWLPADHGPLVYP